MSDLAGSGRNETPAARFNSRVVDALADMTGCAVIPNEDEKHVVVDFDNGLVWLVTVEAAEFKVAP